METSGPRGRLPVVPDRALVAGPGAVAAVDGILAAGKHATRFGGLEVQAARVLASLLRLYAELGEPPSRPRIAAASGLSEAETERLIADLFRRDLVLQGEGLEIRGAYPFTQTVTGHQVTFVRTGRTLNTMCAIDALGAGAMCLEDAIVRSSCQECKTPIVVRVGDRGAALGELHPADAVVWAGFRPRVGSAAMSVCKELLPFCSAEHLDRWKDSRPHSEGRALTMEEALQVGRAFFADRALLGQEHQVRSAEPACPRCGAAGRVVRDETISAILPPATAARLLPVERWFCATPTCSVLYYADGALVEKGEAGVRVGVKETEDPLPLCYCFGFTRADIRREVAETGSSEIPARIEARIRASGCDCVRRNPSGGCCLGDVRTVVLEITADRNEQR